MRLAFIIAIVLLTGCSHLDDLVTSYGPDITVTRHVDDFTKITAGEKFDIFLVQDSAKAGTVEVTAGKHVIDGYTTEVINGELHIKNKNKFNWVRKLKVRQKVVVYFKTLENLQINGSAKFTSLDTIRGGPGSTLRISHGGLEDAHLIIKNDYIYADCTNTGGVFVSGTCFLFSGSVDDISFVDTRDLKAQKAYISSYSRVDSHIDASSDIGIKLFGVGSIYYHTTPSSVLDIEDKGEGQVIKY